MEQLRKSNERKQFSMGKITLGTKDISKPFDYGGKKLVKITRDSDGKVLHFKELRRWKEAPNLLYDGDTLATAQAKANAVGFHTIRGNHGYQVNVNELMFGWMHTVANFEDGAYGQFTIFTKQDLAKYDYIDVFWQRSATAANQPQANVVRTRFRMVGTNVMAEVTDVTGGAVGLVPFTTPNPLSTTRQRFVEASFSGGWSHGYLMLVGDDIIVSTQQDNNTHSYLRWGINKIESYGV